MQGVFRNVERYVYFISQTLIQSTKQCTATGKIDTVVNDVGIQFGRRISNALKMAVSILEIDFSKQCATS